MPIIFFELIQIVLLGALVYGAFICFRECEAFRNENAYKPGPQAKSPTADWASSPIYSK